MDDELRLMDVVVGFGFFVVSGLIARQIAGPGLIIVIWLFARLPMLCGALTHHHSLLKVPRGANHGYGLRVYKDLTLEMCASPHGIQT